MAALGFPVFTGGMTLTQDDLNTLREFLDLQDAVLGRLLGFGVASGLGGTAASGTLRIAPGLAVDQHGRPLVLDEEVALPIADSGRTFPFVDAAAGGTTAVLVLREQDQAAPECGDASCDPHAPLRLRTPEVVLVAGRLRAPLAEFATDPLLALTPLSATAKDGVRGDFDVVRDTVLTRLAALGVDAARRSRLEGLRLTGVTAVRLYKAAYLNQVLFATVELARCRALRRDAEAGTTPEPGVALGWLASPTSTWDCRYRHGFVPSDGLVVSLLGGRCGDPCSLPLERLHSVLDGYVEPTPPSSGGGSTGPFHVCEGKGKRRPWRYDECGLTIFETVPRDVFEQYVVGPDDPFVDPLRDPRPVWEGTPLDVLDSGTISLRPGFGRPAAEVRGQLVEVLGARVTQPDVRIVGQDAVGELEGFTPEVSAAVGDTVVLVTDGAGTVVGTGRVPIGHALRTVGTTVSAASADAAQAVAVATRVEGSVGAQLTGQVAAVQAELATFRSSVTAAVETRLSAGLGALEQRIAAVAAPLAEVRGTVSELAQRAAQLERGQSVLVADVTTVRTQTQTLHSRVDDVLLSGGKGRFLDVGGSPGAAGATLRADEVVAVVDSLKAAVASAATGRQREAVDRQLVAVDEALVPLAGAGATPLPEAEARAVLGVLQGLNDAAKTAGATEARLRDVELGLQGLRGRFR